MTKGATISKIAGDLGVTEAMLSVWISLHPQIDAWGLVASSTINPHGK